MGNYVFKLYPREYGITPIPNIFIDEYMPSADGNFVKVYLSGLVEALRGESISSSMLSQKLGLIESDIIKAWEYWESKGLVRLVKQDNEDMGIEFLNTYRGFDTSAGSNMYSPEHIRLRMANANVKEMFATIEKLLGRTLSHKEISLYLNWIDDYGFTPEVIILLIEYCKSKNKTDFRYIEKVAISWNDSKITSIEDAQKYIAQHEEKFNNYRTVLDFLGLKENDLMKPQEDFLDKWFTTWSFSLEMILEACKICSLRINEPNFNYIDGILSNWYKKGIKSPKDIDTADTKSKYKNVKFKAPVTTFNSYDQRSYDFKDLEKKLLGRDGEAEDEQ